jgi:hypothetical protein
MRSILSALPPIDNVCSQIDIRLMLSKPLTVLLVLLWMLLSGLDLLADLDLANETEFHSSADVPVPGFEHIGKLVNNIVESGDYSRFRCSSVLEQSPAQLSIEAPNFLQKSSKLHKLHHIFLI